jgi:hypothetical protein
MRTMLQGCAVALAAALTIATAPSSQALPAGAHAGAPTLAATDVIRVAAVRHKHHRRAYLDVPVPARPAAPVSAPGCPGLYSWNPANPDRGYCDPGFAYHGNINGCAIDLGYGRWASCDGIR